MKNLPKLLDALFRAAENPEERARALSKRATFHRDSRKDDATARIALQHATNERAE